MQDEALLRELAPVASDLLDRHLRTARDWYPHEYVPWGRGRDYEPGEAWSEPPGAPPPAVRSALFVNLLTEDNLPYYFATIDRMFGIGHPFRVWTRRWTAEEMRHAIVIRDYVTVTRSIDPTSLERARMQQVSAACVPEPPNASEGMVYVALQELATRIAHRNTGKHLTDPVGDKLLSRVAADEALHHLFYRDLTTAALHIDPSTMVVAMAKQVKGFQMPGTGIPGFGRHSRAIAAAGIYDASIFLNQVLLPVVMNHWRLPNINGLSGVAERARDAMFAHFDRMRDVVRRFLERRAESAAATAPT